MSAVLAAAWAALVVAGAALARPRRSRAQLLVPGGVATTARPQPFVERVGTLVLRPFGRSDPALARRVGTVVCAVAPALAVFPVAAVPAAAAAVAVPVLRRRQRQRRRVAAVEASMPEAVDLLQLAVGAGLSVRLAVEAVAQRTDGPLGDELRRAVAETARGRRLADALYDLPLRAGDAVRPLVGVLVACERYGAPLAAGLERLASEVRATSRRRAEEAARRVPVKLLFPLVTCILPAFALLTVAPLIASALRSLRL